MTFASVIVIRTLLDGIALGADIDPKPMGAWPGLLRNGLVLSLTTSNDRLYVADGIAGFHILNIENPTAPELIGSIPPGDQTFDVAAAGDYAFVADGQLGLTVIDISNPTRPTHLRSVWIASNAHHVRLAGEFAYVTGSRFIKVMDISNPTHPIVAGELDFGFTATHSGIEFAGGFGFMGSQGDGFRVLSFEDPTTPRLVATVETSGTARATAISGNTAFVANGRAGLMVVDITDPTAPVHLTDLDTPGSANDVVVAGEYAFVADWEEQLQVIDVSNPGDPEPVLHWNEGGESVIALALHQEYLYLGRGGLGIDILNIRDPRNPVLAGSFHTEGESYNVAVSGDHAYLADSKTGLHVILIVDLEKPIRVGGALDTAYDVEVSGGFAFAATGGRGLQIVDIRDPKNPAPISSLYQPGGVGHSVALAGQNLCFADSESGLMIFDIRRADRARLIGQATLSGLPQGLAATDRFAVVAVGNIGIDVFDISEPTRPIRRAPVTMERGLTAHDVAIVDTMAYVAVGSSGVRMIDLAAPNGPAQVGRIAFHGAYGIHIAGDHALVAGRDTGLHILDIRDPTQPEQIGHLPTVGKMMGVRGFGAHAFAADFYRGLEVIDVRRLAIPQRVGRFQEQVAEFESIAVDGTRAYIGNGLDFVVLDLSDPVNPTRDAAIRLTYVVTDIAVAGKLAYLVTDREGLHIVDSSRPDGIEVVGRLAPDQIPGFASIAVSWPYAYIISSRTGLHVINVEDPSNPIAITSVQALRSSADLALDGNQLYAVGGSEGLRVFELDDPARPELVAQLDIGTSATAISISESHAYITDRAGALRIVDIRDPANPRTVGEFLHAGGPIVDIAIDSDIGYLAVESAAILTLDLTDPTAPRLVGSNRTVRDPEGIAIAGSHVYVANGRNGLSILSAYLPAPRLSARLSEGKIHINWNRGILQSAESPDGNWIDLPGAQQPLQIDATDAKRFFRARTE